MYACVFQAVSFLHASHKNDVRYAVFFSPTCVTCFVTVTAFDANCKSCSCCLLSVLQPPAESFLGQNTYLCQHSIILALTQCSFISVRGQISHAYKPKADIIIPYILICVF